MYEMASSLCNIPGLRHGFFGRKGGVSAENFSSLNASYDVGDARDAVRENRRRVCEALDVSPDSLITLQQVHSPTVCRVSLGTLRHMQGAPLQADGLVTTEPGLCLGILTADCAPILFVDPEARVIGACHAGWRGALEGVVEATVAHMQRAGAQKKRLRVAMGPMIASQSYEVQPPFRATFMEKAPRAAPFFQATGNHSYLFDLKGFIREKIEQIGVASIECSPINTLDGPFFSYRRAGKVRPSPLPLCGRNLSVIHQLF